MHITRYFIACSTDFRKVRAGAFTGLTYVINLLLTEREGRTEEYWPVVVTVQTEPRSVHDDRGSILPSTARAT